MDISLLSLPVFTVMAAYFFAGVVDSICGGGGLIGMPAMLALGFPAHLASGTNQCSNAFGGIVSAVRFIKSGNVDLRLCILAIPCSILGGIYGAKLNIMLPDVWLKVIMVALLPVVAITILLKRDFGEDDKQGTLSFKIQLIRTGIISFLVGLYQGFYGPGSGLFCMLAMCIFMRMSLVRAMANARAILAVSTTTAAVTYAISGLVFWKVAIPCFLANIVGSWLGTELSLTKGAKVIKPMMLVISALLFLKLLSSFFS